MSNALLAQVRADKLKDQTKEQETFVREIAAAGRAMARFIGYVEIGKRKQPDYQGKAKPDCLEVRLAFELLGKKHRKEIEVEGNKKVVYPVIRFKQTVKAGDRANFTKLLKAMTYGREGITHMAMMLGEGFIVNVTHNKSGEGKDEKTYANLWDDTGWNIGAPVRLKDPEDPECDEYVPLNVPEPTQPLQLMLWDDPTKEQWDSIFIDGTHTVKDAKGNSKEVSNNWLQEDMLNATDFDGSALQSLLLSLSDGLDLDGGEAASQEPQDDDLIDDDLPPPATDKAAAGPAGKPSGDPKPKGDPTPSEADDDPLSSFGFDEEA